MSKLKPRTHSTQSVPDVLSSPLPLYKLPTEVKVAKTGCPERLPELPVIRHLLNSPHSPEAILVPTTSSLTSSAAPVMPLPVEDSDDDEDDDDTTRRMTVYSYYDPGLTHMESATTLQFDSIFESGNLLRADRVRYLDHPTQDDDAFHEYELYIHPDINNSAYRQWFYFSVTNGVPGTSYRFAIVNLAKSGALFKIGLQPVVYSELDAAENGVGWRHRGHNISYEPSSRQEGSNTLSFTYTFSRPGDRVYFACIQPYTYTDLQEYLDALGNDPDRSVVCRRTELCLTLAGNSCDLLTITAPGKEGKSVDGRRVIFISARVHPGEANSSFMMKGMIDYLTSKACGAVVLRNNFVFKIAPMLNPDGVINGNTRVNLAGWDLNRKWAYPVEKLFPTIFHLKRLITNYQRPQPPLGMPRVAIYCDLHGHSIQRNIFTYGCFKPTRKAKPPSESKLVASDDPRVFPMLVAKHSDMFSFAHCNFKVQPSKRNTARVVVHQELGVVNSYTLEASFCGPDFGVRKDTQFSIADLEAMGVHWCRTLLVYFDLTGEVAAEEDLIQRQGPPQQPHESSTNNLREKHIISIPSATTLTPSAHDCTVPTKEHDGPEGRLWHSNVLNACESELSGLTDMVFKEELFENGMCCNDCDSDVSEAADDAIAPNHALPEVYTPSVVKKPKKGKKAKKGKNAAKKKKLKKKRGSIKDETCQAAEVVLKLSKTSTGAIVVPDSTPLAGQLVGRRRFSLDLSIDLPTNVYMHLKQRPSSSSSVPSVSPTFALASDSADTGDVLRLVRPTSG
ncbi:hypothetical protein H310_00331 [Aphanomyces invadans]|uniref:Peptidase M14 domain-containing protein n=1 Tax=Aphanomyces invadans TaxID=157072 RepID=A0A024UVE9_9STRA|nr:hypothetical protein H310_00331 [Aphanomyces invadans]ETW09887.1 hypothetical protein H310_00331 [Aphanomyces invadans]|eukprot:XP_008861298.1 hypothetical protein H310_00331 [Aphanomyces invadans]